MPPDVQSVLLDWNIPPLTTLALLITALVYVRGWLLIGRTRPEQFPEWRLGCFLAGLFTLFLAVASPLDTLDDRVLAAHMVQHFLFMSIAPPLLLLASLLGSYVNIPLFQLSNESVLSGQEVIAYGMVYVVPEVVNWPGAIVAINVGGAVIPCLMSLYLLYKHRLWVRGPLAALGVAAIAHMLARPVPGVGIVIPIFLPPLAALIVAFLLSWRFAAPLAYIGGSMGALIGADLLNLGNISGLGAPVASIGGAGTFDGVFMTGIIAVLIASIAAPTPLRRSMDPRKR